MLVVHEKLTRAQESTFFYRAKLFIAKRKLNVIAQFSMLNFTARGYAWQYSVASLRATL